jgi:hypothetical protein
MAHATVALTAHQGSPLKDLLEQAPPRSRAYTSLGWAPPRSRAHASPRAGFASLEGMRRPRAGSASLEGASHAHAHSRTRVWAFNVLTTAGGAIMRLGLAPRSCCTNSLGGNPSPPLWGTVRRGRCQSRDAAPPTLVRLTRRALEGGPAAPSIYFPVTLQG